jgi:formiminoglutamate deiminase
VTGSWWCEHAWVDGAAVPSVRVEEDDGVVTAVVPGVPAQPGDVRLAGLVLPGLANAHSHAFHRALRGRTHGQGGTFWTWRDGMYAVAERLDPDSYLGLARAAYAEMALAGITRVGEFHYLHHGPRGVPYDDPNAMGRALVQAAADAGLRLTLLDTCYLTGGLTVAGHTPMSEAQQRFGDGDADRWAARVEELRASVTASGLVVGAAVHSVRAVPRAQLTAMGQAMRGWRAGEPALPLHAHVSEQPAENEVCQGFYGLTPTGLLHETGLLGPATTAVHATHLTSGDIEQLGASRTTACFCPTTERDLADGIGPARALLDAGAPLSLGSDQHAVVDPFEEARALESHERLITLQRGRFSPAELVTAMTSAGHGCLGRPTDGRIAVGAVADLVAVRLDSPRTAGSLADQAVYCATAADVHTVVCAGRTVVKGGEHVLGDVGSLLRKAIGPLWSA